jgi:hypothetical protein
MTDYRELVKRLREHAENMYVDFLNEAAGALEAQAKEIAEKDAIIKELEAYVEHIAEQKLTEEMDADIREIADYEGAYNYMITDARDYLRAACAALKGT